MNPRDRARHRRGGQHQQPNFDSARLQSATMPTRCRLTPRRSGPRCGGRRAAIAAGLGLRRRPARATIALWQHQHRHASAGAVAIGDPNTAVASARLPSAPTKPPPARAVAVGNAKRHRRRLGCDRRQLGHRYQRRGDRQQCDQRGVHQLGRPGAGSTNTANNQVNVGGRTISGVNAGTLSTTSTERSTALSCSRPTPTSPTCRTTCSIFRTWT